MFTKMGLMFHFTGARLYRYDRAINKMGCYDVSTKFNHMNYQFKVFGVFFKRTLHGNFDPSNIRASWFWHLIITFDTRTNCLRDTPVVFLWGLPAVDGGQSLLCSTGEGWVTRRPRQTPPPRGCNFFIIYHMHILVCKKYHRLVITTNTCIAVIYRRYM